TPTTEFYTLSLHDALPICYKTVYISICRKCNKTIITTSIMRCSIPCGKNDNYIIINCILNCRYNGRYKIVIVCPISPTIGNNSRSEEHTSELQSRENLVCR